MTETLSQAKEFERRLARYVRSGLCHRCAAQAAFGHVDGWENVHAPCVACAVIVETFDTPTTNPSWNRILDPLKPVSGGRKGTPVPQPSGGSTPTSEWSAHAPTTRFWSPV